MRDLTDGQAIVRVEAETVEQLINSLNFSFPGVKERLCEFGKLRKDLIVVVDGKASKQGFSQNLAKTSEVSLLPIVSGG